MMKILQPFLWIMSKISQPGKESVKLAHILDCDKSSISLFFKLTPLELLVIILRLLPRSLERIASKRAL